ncbi:MAG: amino acid ABC transporter substrate-binding protein, partial [bacterium]|nr:amino acid ABC transporter substrate-binding protein [bacterium]
MVKSHRTAFWSSRSTPKRRGRRLRIPWRRNRRAGKWRGFPATALALVLLLLAAGANAGSGEEPPPYADLTSKPYEYHGRGRDLAEPVDLAAVRIGLFAPTQGPRAPAGLSLRRGAELAVAEANAAGGYRGIPFALIQRSDDQVWGSAREVVEMAYDDGVWAIIGAIGGQSTHVAQQVITKAQLPLISPASTDASLTQINIPWMFRCP